MMKQIVLITVLSLFSFLAKAQNNVVEAQTETVRFNIQPASRTTSEPDYDFTDVPQVKDNYRAIIIGVQDYTNNTWNLTFPATDAKALYDVLTQID